MRYGSVCSGIEAASVAWGPLGWCPAWFAEIAKFPSAVLAHRHPGVPNHGSLIGLANRLAGGDRELDLLVGGTPCQSFSIAGLRGGLADERGNLALEFARLAQALRPRWLLWENVPGVLSSDGGRAFGSILGALAQLGYGLAWRVLDAQFVRVDGYGRAVPQRRERVFLVGHLGSAARAGAVLFEPEGVRGNPPPRRQTREDVAGTLGGGSSQRGWCSDTDRTTFIPEVAKTVRAQGQDPHAEDLGTYIPEAARALTTNTRIDGESETFCAFNARQDPLTYQGVRGPLDTDGSTYGVEVNWRVRRLTPRECERLQGFPDDYTLVPVGKTPAKDSPRYAALGNSMAVNVMRWIGQRIELVDRIKEDA